jgi:hypothetical protein
MTSERQQQRKRRDSIVIGVSLWIPSPLTPDSPYNFPYVPYFPWSLVSQQYVLNGSGDSSNNYFLVYYIITNILNDGIRCPRCLRSSSPVDPALPMNVRLRRNVLLLGDTSAE